MSNLKIEKKSEKMKVAFLTLGCKVNYYETEKMAERLAESGFEIVDFSVGADIYVVNTCTVTNIADRKSRQMLSRARKKNPDAFIVACGCYVDAAGKNHLIKNADVKVDDLIRQGVIDIAIGNEDKDNIANILSSVIGKKSPFTGESKSVYKRERTRAFLKIQDGCNQFCTYCLIPYVRGGGTLHSAPKEDVLKEVRRLAKNGVKEVVLNGIHLSSYGVDTLGAGGFLELEGKPLLSLIEEVASIEGISRIRLGSLEPRIITESFAVTLSRIDKVCPHFHLSMQSGSDETLKRMNRHYTSETYKKKVGQIGRASCRERV